MKRIPLILVLAIAGVGSAFAAQPVNFKGSIWQNGGVNLEFEDRIPPGQTRTMRLSAGHTVEMSVDAAGASRVRLTDRNGAELHSSLSPPGDADTKAFMYAFCRRGGVAYSSPPHAGQTGCP